LVLGRGAPACKAAIEAAAPHVKVAASIARGSDATMGSKMLVFLTKARADDEEPCKDDKDDEEPCKDDKGVLGGILRAKNMMYGIGAKAPN